ncbi:MAG: replication initiation protein [Dysgonamonadaceae bacterium]|jgi:hypothetical protein|nr:replication initiation protein [Dysgonamonadaceae bacterium]
MEGTNKEQKAKKKPAEHGKYEMKRKGLPRTKKKVLLPVNLTKLKQSNMITTMQADYSITHQRILITLIDKLQPHINGIINGYRQYEKLDLFEDFERDTHIRIKIPIKDFGIPTGSYGKFREALLNIASIPVEFDTTDPETGREMWGFSGFFSAYMHKEKYNREVHIVIQKDIAKKVVFALTGYTQYYKEIALSSSNKYTPRIYMLISSWKSKGGFSIKYEKFRKLLGVGDKYQDYWSFYKRAIRPVYEELFEKADVWFEVAEIYDQESDKNPSLLSFKVVRGIMTAKEQEQLKIQSKNLYEMWIRHLHLKNEQAEDVLRFLTIENYSEITNKTIELHQYLNEHRKDISNPSNYFFKALMNALCPDSENELV